MAPNRQKKKVKKGPTSKKRAVAVERSTPLGTVISPVVDAELVNKWPKLNIKVPPIFLLKEGNLEFDGNLGHFYLDMAKSGINFYYILNVNIFLKFTFPTMEDHKATAQYFDRKKMSYYTYGYPNKRKLKVMIIGLPKNTDLIMVKEELKKLHVPVIRIHQLHTSNDNVRPLIVMVVVPYAEDGKEILKIKKILGHEVLLEPPQNKPKQCYRCQKWGHSQRYCHFTFKCVKCAGDHFYKKCTKLPNTPAKCANCEGDHTANYKDCAFSPHSEIYKKTFEEKLAKEKNNRQKKVTRQKKLLSQYLLENETTLNILNQKKADNMLMMGSGPEELHELCYASNSSDSEYIF